jgi:hypothetical protein
MVLIWSSIVLAKLGRPENSHDKKLMVAMIAALCCVVPFLRKYVTYTTTLYISRVNILIFSHRFYEGVLISP